MFVVGVNQVAILKLEDVTKRTPEAGRGGGGNSASLQAGFQGYQTVLPKLPRRGSQGRAARRRSLVGRDRSHGRRRDQGRRDRRKRADARRSTGSPRRRSIRSSRISPTAARRPDADALAGEAAAPETFPPGPVVATRWRTAASPSAAPARTVLSGRRRKRGQRALSARREGRAAEPLHDRLRRARELHQAAVHDVDRVRPQHR